MLENEDAALVKACLEGDTKAFGKLVDKYQKPIFNAAFRMCGNYDDAKDIAQSTFVKAYEKLRGFDSNGKFFSWIYRIMMNETIDFLAYVRRHTTGVDETIESQESNPEEEYQKKQLADKLDKEMMQLSVDSRAVIVLRHYADLSLGEISYILDVPEKTVKSRLFTARERLKIRLIRRGMTESI